MTDKELNKRIKMIIQAYKAEFIDRFRAWEEIQKVIGEWEKSKE